MPPLHFLPIIKRIRWGGRRLGERLGKPIGEGGDYAESWEVVDHGDDQSVVAEGSLEGQALSSLVAGRGDELFGPGRGRDQFPLLIKFLDASDRLSVQVHPDDALAKRHDPVENGKTEAWVILDAEPSAVLWCGLKNGVTESQMRDALASDTVASLLHEVAVRPGDCVFIPAGTVHAIGEGILLAEVQQSSDLTFRYYDWGRVGADGNPRELHIDESMEATDWLRGPVDPVVPQPMSGADGSRTERLVGCDYFTLSRHIIDSDFAAPDDGRLHVYMALSGTGTLTGEEGPIAMPTGKTVVLPAVRDAVSIRTDDGPLALLDATIDD